MAESDVALPPCGHTDRLRQLTELEIEATTGQMLHFLVCSVPACPEYCRVFADLRDPWDLESDEPSPRDPPSDGLRTPDPEDGEPALA
jgi:hypothetical protein